jgi:hypothetical protein
MHGGKSPDKSSANGHETGNLSYSPGSDGLAMSSRNKRLDKEQRKNAVAIYKALSFIKENIKTRKTTD